MGSAETTQSWPMDSIAPVNIRGHGGHDPGRSPPELLLSQSTASIHPGRVSRRNQTRRHPNQSHQHHRPGNGHRIGWADAVQDTGGDTKRTECEGKTDEDTNGNEHEGSSENHRQYLLRLSPHGDAYADLTRSLNNGETNQTVQS